MIAHFYATYGLFGLALVALSAAYCLLLVAYAIGWRWQRLWQAPKDFIPTTFISIIVPARNEEQNIAACINSILAQDYLADLFEVIVVDDHSDDNTAAVVTAYNNPRVRCISLADVLPPGARLNSYKKAALTAGIQQSKGTLIITTDADCTAPTSWLRQIAAYYQQHQPSMIVAPVMFTGDGSILQIFQSIDFMTMQGITGATHRLKLGQMSNGANLAFSKDVFNAVGGYTGVDHLATGDDYLLMMKIAQHPGATIAYLKSPQAVISTLPQTSWGGFLQQRIRWASKSGKYDDRKLTMVLLLVYLYNVSFLAMVVVGLFLHPFFCLAACLFAAKIASEYLLLIPTAMFFKRPSLLFWFPFLQPLHICYITVAGFLGFVGKYQWKGREVR